MPQVGRDHAARHLSRQRSAGWVSAHQERIIGLGSGSYSPCGVPKPLDKHFVHGYIERHGQAMLLAVMPVKLPFIPS
jgi:hypothetical protein